jgi:hypothetical protein
MDASILIARLMGPILVVVGLVALRDPEGLRAVGREFLDSRALLYLAGLLALVIGLAIVNTHNRWVLGWPLIITLYGWLALLGGILRLGFRDQVRRLGEAMLARPTVLRISGAAQLALGALLTVVGYL